MVRFGVAFQLQMFYHRQPFLSFSCLVCKVEIILQIYRIMMRAKRYQLYCLTSADTQYILISTTIVCSILATFQPLKTTNKQFPIISKFILTHSMTCFFLSLKQNPFQWVSHSAVSLSECRKYVLQHENRKDIMSL